MFFYSTVISSTPCSWWNTVLGKLSSIKVRIQTRWYFLRYFCVDLTFTSYLSQNVPSQRIVQANSLVLYSTLLSTFFSFNVLYAVERVALELDVSLSQPNFLFFCCFRRRRRQLLHHWQWRSWCKHKYFSRLFTYLQVAVNSRWTGITSHKTFLFFSP